MGRIFVVNFRVAPKHRGIMKKKGFARKLVFFVSYGGELMRVVFRLG